MIHLQHLNPSNPPIKHRLPKTAADCFVCISPHCEDGHGWDGYSLWLDCQYLIYVARKDQKQYTAEWSQSFDPRGYEPGSLKHIKGVLRWKSEGDTKMAWSALWHPDMFLWYVSMNIEFCTVEVILSLLHTPDLKNINILFILTMCVSCWSCVFYIKKNCTILNGRLFPCVELVFKMFCTLSVC